MQHSTRPLSGSLKSAVLSAAGVLALSLFLILAVAVRTAAAAPGDLDPKFSGDGYAELAIGQKDHAGDLLYTGHRRVVVSVTDGKLALAGIDRHGRLDPAFGKAGLVRVPISSTVYSASGTVDPSGRLLVVVSTSGTSGNQSYVLRFDHDGKVDSSFGYGGVVLVPGVSLLGFAVHRVSTAAGAPGRHRHGGIRDPRTGREQDAKR